jgi:hypothetical protein
METSISSKIFCIIFFYTFFPRLQAQKYNVRQIDSLQTKCSQSLYQKGQLSELIELHKMALEKSIEMHYSIGELRGYIELANYLCGMDMHAESLYYLRLAERKLQTFDNKTFKTRLKIIYGRNYQALGLYNQAIGSFNDAIKLAYQIPSKAERDDRLFFIYDWKRFTFTRMNLQDSAAMMEKKCLAMPNPGFIIYMAIADRYITQKKLDSAEYFLNKSTSLIKHDNAEARAMILQSFGKLHLEKSEYDKSLQFFMESAKITEEAKLKKRSLDVYKLIADTYNRMNNTSKENEYILKYYKLNDSLNQAEKKSLDNSIEKIIIERGANDEKNKSNLYIILIVIIFFTISIIFILLNVYQSKQKEKDSIIDQKEKETYILRRKLDTTFEEIIQLAINNDPLFIQKFKEVYSEFYDNLTSKYPQLTSSDIKFCAFIKLKFSNKEIAQYSHMSIRTVESKKYRIKKKIGLDPKIDFNNWILNL